MSSMVTYKRLKIVTPTPTGDGGLALNTDFEAIDDLVIFNQGTWNSTQAYLPNDLVVSSGTYYLCLAGNTNNAPPSSAWQAISGGGGSTPTLEAVTTAGATTDQTLTLSGGASLAGSTLNANDGSGSGGGTWNVDSGTIQIDTDCYVRSALNDEPYTGIEITSNSSDGGIAISSPNSGINISSVQIQFDGSPVHMFNGSGSGGGTLNLDGGTISGGSSATLNDYGYGWSIGTTIGPDTPVTITLQGADGNSQFSDDGLGHLTITATGGTVNFSQNQLINAVIDNESSAPSSPVAGQIYFDTTSGHFYGWNGTAWKQLDN